ncbi:MAG TPA: M23 family metallopeptidase, partial [Egibacteraceae bacterium]|nr:M23 family metallopeptidase [Egibacteraceae bacterium]
ADLLGDLDAEQARLDALRADLAGAFEQAQDREAELEGRQARKRSVDREGQRGTYSCPLAHPFSFRDTWGAPRSGGRRHKGVDMFAPMGADAYAITDGVIARHSTSRLGGLGLYLAGDDGNVYYYAHLQEILPTYRPGARVESGERIARNGDSGNAYGGAPHIHMEVRPGGGPNVNPYPFTAAACF